MLGVQLDGNLEHLGVPIMSDQIDQMLGLKTWAVVGLSNNSERAAYGVAKVLIENGHQVIPVHPKAESVHGQTGYAKLTDIPVPVDVVDIFVNSSLAGSVVDEAIKIGKYSHLIYNYPNGTEELNIEDYNITQRELNRLLILYRGRSQKEH